jgi:hypothetical protein
MKSLEEIKSQLQAGQFEFTRHALKRDRRVECDDGDD